MIVVSGIEKMLFDMNNNKKDNEKDKSRNKNELKFDDIFESEVKKLEKDFYN